MGKRARSSTSPRRRRSRSHSRDRGRRHRDRDRRKEHRESKYHGRDREKRGRDRDRDWERDRGRNERDRERRDRDRYDDRRDREEESRHRRSERSRHDEREERGERTRDSKRPVPDATHSERVKPSPSLPTPPPQFLCHICGSNHWTSTCSRLHSQPDKYPLMSPKGCFRCARLGHRALQCRMKAFRCLECGGMHPTRECAYDYPSVEWHEFYDEVSGKLFYTNTDESVQTWCPSINTQDTITWYCRQCSLMIPHKYQECLKCHAPRPQPKEETEEEASEASVDDSDDTSSIVSSSSSSSSSS